MKYVVWPDGSPASYVPPRPGVVTTGFRASSEFGRRTHPITGLPSTMHYGIDLVGIADGYVRAPFSGKVTIARYFGGYGNLVEITAPDGDRARLGHNKSFLVREGQQVVAGEAVAVWNSTGSSTGTHCHLETIPYGSLAVNPREYIADHIPTSDGDDMSDIEVFNVKFDGGQAVTETEAYLRVDADGISVYSGAGRVWGGLVFYFDVSKAAGKADSHFQVKPVVVTVKGGKVVDETSLGAQTFLYTRGRQSGQVVVPPVEMVAGQRLRFKVRTYDGAKIILHSARFRGAVVKPPTGK